MIASRCDKSPANRKIFILFRVFCRLWYLKCQENPFPVPFITVSLPKNAKEQEFL